MKKRNGFTLIELLAVIIVLAIIALIAMPIIFNVIENAKVKSLENSAYGVVDAVRLQYMENLMNSENGEVPLNGSVTALPLSGEHPTGGNWEIKNGSEVTEGRGIKITDVTFASMQGYVCNSEEDANNNLTGKVICSKQSQGTPTITFELADGTINNNGWAKANFNVKITATGTTGLKYCLSTSDCTPNQDVPSNGIDVEVEGTNYVCAVAEGLSVKCNAYNLDKTTPTLTAKESAATLTLGESKEISTYLNTATYGPSNGSVVCKTNGSEITNTSGLEVGSHTVTCVATSNSGLSSSDVTLTITVEEEATNLITLAVDANSNGVAELGDEVCIGNECFYVLTNDGSSIRMLAKYRIDVSANTTRKERLQSPFGEGTLTTAFSSSSIHGTNYDSYEGSIVEDLVGDYKTTLERMGATISEATLLSYDEVTADGQIIFRYLSADADLFISLKYHLVVIEDNGGGTRTSHFHQLAEYDLGHIFAASYVELGVMDLQLLIDIKKIKYHSAVYGILAPIGANAERLIRITLLCRYL